MTLDEAIKHCEEVAEENQAIVDSCDYYGENMAKCEECAKEHRQLARWLKELKQLREQMSDSEKPNKWIPVSERKPKKGQTVLTFDTYYNKFGINALSSDGLTWRKYTNHVTAWMPLPEPYKAESEE